MEYGLVKLAVIAVVGLGAAVGALNKAAWRASLRARMRRAQRTFEDGAVVTLTGTVRALGEPMLAPLSGTPCVLHRSSARIFQAEYVRVEMVEFALDTRDGPVIVTGDTAEVTLRPGKIVPRRIQREAKFLRANGSNVDPNRGSFDEVVIEPGSKIAVHGIARVEAATAATGERGYRDAPTMTRIVGDADHPLTIAST